MFAVGDADCGVSGPVGNSKRYEINKSDPSLYKKRYKTGKQNRGLRPRSPPILELANLEIPDDITSQAHSRSTTPVGTRRARRDMLIRSSSGERGTSL